MKKIKNVRLSKRFVGIIPKLRISQKYMNTRISYENQKQSLDEAAMYSGIGKNKLRELSDGEGKCFTFFNGTKRMIKRKEFISRVHTI